ncbi:glutamate racemase [Alloscardovia macacae]|uniref:Glutamate racemase n=1 Tax=Alloscardovia macacae TaxID=1160091 RepID=A0A1Y2SX83_9BIFI|nr:glutamate racemase [Alloscardovia macacae]OTA28668.1 glutamate racemase [Alloscardovia macacae]
MPNNAPIGVFDSGMGGISVVNQIHQELPQEDILFFGDSANAPYGTRSTADVQKLSFAVADHLIDLGAKALVIACNTATSAAAQAMRERYSIPIIGMEPALKLACDLGHGEPQHVIVTATPLTLREKKFAALMERFSAEHKIDKLPCPKLVEIVENGQIQDADLVRATLAEYLAPFDLSSVNSIVLGCTHFTYYRDYFRAAVPEHVHIVDGNDGTARHLHDVLERINALAERDTPGSVTLDNSSPDPRMRALGESFLQ